MAFLPNTSSRVFRSTSTKINERIQSATAKRVEHYCGSDSETISKRLDELNREWDVERVVETAASSHVILGLVLGALVDRRWFAWSFFVAGFLLVHALFGWFPALPILRRMGFRTEAEIEQERDALRLIRGDFKATKNPREALAQARLSTGPTVAGATLADTR
jgi:hypothetical protein